MSDFLKSNFQLDEAIAGANSYEAMREAMLQTLAAQGRVVRSKNDAYDVRVLRQPDPEPNVSLPANGFKYEKDVHFAPSTGKRSLVIRANTIEDLDALERQVTGQ